MIGTYVKDPFYGRCDEIQEMEYVPPLASLIKRRQHVLCR